MASIIEVVLSFLVFTVFFAIIYKIVPRVRIGWKDVWIGAVATSLLFTVGKFLIGVYIGRSGIASGFGAAASLVVVLVWVYYSAQIFLLGAEFTRATRTDSVPAGMSPRRTLPPRSLQRRHPNVKRRPAMSESAMFERKSSRARRPLVSSLADHRSSAPFAFAFRRTASRRRIAPSSRSGPANKRCAIDDVPTVRTAKAGCNGEFAHCDVGACLQRRRASK